MRGDPIFFAEVGGHRKSKDRLAGDDRGLGWGEHEFTERHHGAKMPRFDACHGVLPLDGGGGRP